MAHFVGLRATWWLENGWVAQMSYTFRVVNKVTYKVNWERNSVSFYVIIFIFFLFLVYKRFSLDIYNSVRKICTQTRSKLEFVQ